MLNIGHGVKDRNFKVCMGVLLFGRRFVSVPEKYATHFLIQPNYLWCMVMRVQYGTWSQGLEIWSVCT